MSVVEIANLRHIVSSSSNRRRSFSCCSRSRWHSLRRCREWRSTIIERSSSACL